MMRQIESRHERFRVNHDESPCVNEPVLISAGSAVAKSTSLSVIEKTADESPRQ
jgi:hypothetical protein